MCRVEHEEKSENKLWSEKLFELAGVWELSNSQGQFWVWEIFQRRHSNRGYKPLLNLLDLFEDQSFHSWRNLSYLLIVIRFPFIKLDIYTEYEFELFDK